MIVPPLKPTMMITTIVDFLRELVSELSFQAPYFVYQVFIRLYVFLSDMSRLAWF
jgi:hypothetical protein